MPCPQARVRPSAQFMACIVVAHQDADVGTHGRLGTRLQVELRMSGGYRQGFPMFFRSLDEFGSIGEISPASEKA